MTTSRAKLVCSTLGLSFLVLLPFLALFFLTSDEYLPVDSDPVAHLIGQGRYTQAYRLLLRLNPDELGQPDRELLEFQLAVCERLLDRPERAYARLARLEGSQLPLEHYRDFWMARSLEDMGEREGAIAAYGDFLITSRHRVLNNFARLRLAALHATGEDYDSALPLYRELLKSAPEQTAEVLYLMAQISAQKGDTNEARRRWLQLMETYPNSRRALEAMAQFPSGKSAQETYARAMVHFEHDQFGRAIGKFEKFLGAHPRHQLTEEVHYMLGRTYLKNGRYDQARQIFEKVFKKYGRPSALFRIGGIQVRRNQEAAAIATYEKFIRLFPRHELAAEGLWQAAKAAERNDHFDVAEQFYRRLANDYPDSEHRDEAGWNIGFMFYCREEYEKALIIFQRLSKMTSEPHIVDQCLFWAGKTAECLGRGERALSYFRQAARGFPRSYYSARAATLFEEAPLEPRPVMALRAHPETEGQLVRGMQYLRRADILHRLGLNDLARRELQAAESVNSGNLDALRVIRDRYEVFGLLNRAMRLSTQIFVSNGGQGEIHRIYPNYYWDQIVEAAREAEIDPYLVLSVIRQESSFKKDAISKAGALGLMQIMPQTGRSLARSLGLRRFERRSLLDPAVSIRLGSRFLGDQVRSFAEGSTREIDYELGLAAYNAGSHNARRWVERLPHQDPDAFVERIPYRETRLYVKLVLKNYTIYKALSDV